MSKHPNKAIRAAIKYAQSKGWIIEEGGSHCWGKMYYPISESDGKRSENKKVPILCTPKNPENHAKRLKNIVDKFSF